MGSRLQNDRLAGVSVRVTIRPAVVLTFRSPVVRGIVFFGLSVVRAALISLYVYVAFGTFFLWRWRLLERQSVS